MGAYMYQNYFPYIIFTYFIQILLDFNIWLSIS